MPVKPDDPKGGDGNGRQSVEPKEKMDEKKENRKDQEEKEDEE